MKEFGWNVNVQHNEHRMKAHLWEDFALICLARQRSVVSAWVGTCLELCLPTWPLLLKGTSNLNGLKQSR